MANDVKWIKITTDMFDNRKLKHLRRLPDGNNIVLIWVMLLIMAGRCNAGGMIFLTENIPYTAKMLADELDFEENTVQLALKALEQLNMIVSDSGFFKVAGWEEYQNIDGLEKIKEQTRKRVAAHREKQRALMESSLCQYCGAKATGYDHIVAVSRGGIDADENKVPCCPECNRIKNDKPVVDFLNANRQRIRDDIVAENVKLRKFVTLCNVTGRYIVTQGNATDKELESDLDVKKEEKRKSVKETTRAIFDRLLPEYALPDLLQEKMTEWITYKTERKESYKEQGMKTLLRQVENNAMKYGAQALCDLIDDSMANGWKGIIFDRLGQKQNKAQTFQQPTYKKQTKAEELDDFYNLAAEWSKT